MNNQAAILANPEDQILDQLANDGVYLSYQDLSSVFQVCDAYALKRSIEAIYNLMYLTARGKLKTLHLPILTSMIEQLIENNPGTTHPVIKNVTLHALACETVNNPIDLGNINIVVIDRNWNTTVLRNNDYNHVISHPSILVPVCERQW